ncbi:hypothetical protein ACFDR9_002828 [Janthinobacterium sp. CG_23.3]|uniref:hypothetical protein n=1 Tax=Janthinobacterium sp. CG_23.3 TaxID=3349634 RepID=UPI0038D3C932
MPSHGGGWDCQWAYSMRHGGATAARGGVFYFTIHIDIDIDIDIDIGADAAPRRRPPGARKSFEKKACVGIGAGEKPLQVQGSCKPTIGRQPARGAAIYNFLRSSTKTLHGRRGADKTAAKQSCDGAKSAYSRVASAKS